MQRTGFQKHLLSFVALNAVALFAVAPASMAADKVRFAGDPVVVMETNKGTVKMEIYKKEAPITSNNFLDLVGKNFYNGLKFHRVEPGFVIQGGDPKGNGTGGYMQGGKERTIKLEKKANLTHDSEGTVAMARSQDPDSASSQFYITLGPASFLDNPPGYAVFGKVLSGMDVVKNIAIGDQIKKAYIQQ